MGVGWPEKISGHWDQFLAHNFDADLDVMVILSGDTQYHIYMFLPRGPETCFEIPIGEVTWKNIDIIYKTRQFADKSEGY